VRDLPQRYQPSTTVLLAANVAAAQAPVAVVAEPAAPPSIRCRRHPAQADVSAPLPVSAEDGLAAQDRLPETASTCASTWPGSN
jgi:ABC-type nitrate/sulfonate/bicarbonate transport system substrate-binding protein